MACRVSTLWKGNDNNAICPLRQTTLCCESSTITNISITGKTVTETSSYTAELVFDYFDIIGNHYRQTLQLNLTLRAYVPSISLYTYKMQEPVYIKE